METIAKRILLFISISSIPMLLVTAMWLLTVGYFNWFDAIYSEPYAVFTSFFVFSAFIMSLIVPSNEL